MVPVTSMSQSGQATPSFPRGGRQDRIEIARYVCNKCSMRKTMRYTAVHKTKHEGCVKGAEWNSRMVCANRSSCTDGLNPLREDRIIGHGVPASVPGLVAWTFFLSWRFGAAFVVLCVANVAIVVFNEDCHEEIRICIDAYDAAGRYNGNGC